MVQTRGKRSRAGCADENRPLKVAKKLIKKREKVKSRVVEQAVSSGEQRTQQQPVSYTHLTLPTILRV